MEKYINECILSCIKESDIKTEIHFINDGSNDNTKNIYFSIIEKYKNINYSFFYYEFNKIGPGNSRNIILKKINTDVVVFLDADDFINKKGLDIISKEIISKNLDYALPRVKAFSDNLSYCYNFDNSRNKLLNRYYKITNLKKDHEIINTETSMCMKIFNNKFIKNNKINFSDSLFCEDVFPSFYSVIKANKILLIDIDYYFYRLDRIGQRTSNIHESSMYIIKLIDDILNLIKNENLNDELIVLSISKLCNLYLWSLDLTPNEYKENYLKAGYMKFNELDKNLLKKVKPRLNMYSREWYFIDSIVFNYGKKIEKSILNNSIPSLLLRKIVSLRLKIRSILSIVYSKPSSS